MTNMNMRGVSRSLTRSQAVASSAASGGNTVSNDQTISHTYMYTTTSATGLRVAGTGTGLALYGNGDTLLNGLTTSTAAITGGAYGARIAGPGASVENAGTIAGVGTYKDQLYLSTTVSSFGAVGIALALTDGGDVSNEGAAAGSALISGSLIGIDILGGPGMVSNNGTVLSDTAYGRARYTGSGTATFTGYVGSAVVLQAGGSVMNGGSIGSALISGARYGVLIGGAVGTVVNAGRIVGESSYLDNFYRQPNATYPTYGFAGVGVLLADGGTVDNTAPGARITGGVVGVSIAAPGGTVLNAGTIASSYSNDVGGYFSTAGCGVSLSAGGYVRNGGSSDASARIVGYGHAVAISGGYGTVVNDGTIGSAGFGFYGWGVSLAAGGTVVNGNALRSDGALIYGGAAGVVVAGAAGFVANYGIIASSYYYPAVESGIVLRAGGTVINGSSVVGNAIIFGGQYGILLAGGGTVLNAGTIEQTASLGSGIALRGGGYVLNGASGTILSRGDGIYVAAGNATVVNFGIITTTTGIIFGGGVDQATVLNAGTIGALSGQAIEFGSASALLRIVPGAVFHGHVTADGSAGNTIELLAGTVTGHISGVGSIFSGFDTIAADPGARWAMGGYDTAASTLNVRLQQGSSLQVRGSLFVGQTLSLAGSGELAVSQLGQIAVGGSPAGPAADTLTVNAATTGGAMGTVSGSGVVTSVVVDNGGIYADGGVLKFTNRVLGTGTISIGSNAVLDAAWRLDVAQVSFLPGGNGQFLIAAPQVMGAAIAGFAAGDRIDLTSTIGTAAVFSGTTDLLTIDTAGGPKIELQFSGSYAANAFQLTPDGHGGTLISLG